MRRQQPESWWAEVERHPDPWGLLVDWRRNNFRRSLLLGLDQWNNPAHAEPDSPLLVIGPPGSNKSASIMIVNALMAVGPLFCISSRVDIFRATARIRGRMGVVGHFSATGKQMPGARSWRFSPLQGCDDYTYATKFGYRWASWIDRSEYALQSGARGHPHFRQRCAALLRALFYIAAVQGYDMGWVYDFVTLPNLSRRVVELSREMDLTDDPAMARALQSLDFVLEASFEERGSILTTTANALSAYDDPEVVAHSREPNLDFHALVRGRNVQTLIHGAGSGVLANAGIFPLMWGSYDSLYITDASSESPTAFIYLDIEYRMREAMYEYAEELEMQDERPMPLTVINDEAAVAPPASLNDFLAQMRDRGVLFVMALQSLSQARSIFGPMGEDFLTLFRTAVIFRGIKDPQTLKALSTLAGTYWQDVASRSHGSGPGGPTSGDSEGPQRVPRLDEYQIARGHPEWPDGVLVLDSAAKFTWVICRPYFRDAPWPQLIVNALEHTTDGPLPPLSKEGSYAYLEANGLADRYRALQER